MIYTFGSGPFHKRVFARHTNLMEISPYCNSIVGHQIATTFCTYHDGTYVVPCTNFCSDHCFKIEVRVKRNFHRIWIAMEKPLVKRGPQLVHLLPIHFISGYSMDKWLHSIPFHGNQLLIPYPNFNGCSAKPSLKLGYIHTLDLCRWDSYGLLIHILQFDSIIRVVCVIYQILYWMHSITSRFIDFSLSYYTHWMHPITSRFIDFYLSCICRDHLFNLYMLYHNHIVLRIRNVCRCERPDPFIP